MTPQNDDKTTDAIDAALQEWRQGDGVVGEHWFVHRFDPQTPLTGQAKIAAEQEKEADLAEVAVAGLVVVSRG